MTVGQVGTWPVRNRRIARAVYWIASLAGSALLGLAATQRGLGLAIGVMTACLLFVVGVAIAYTPYLKIGGRVIASHVDDSRPDEPDGTSPPFSRGSASESYDGTHRADVMWWGTATGAIAIAVITVLARWQPGLLFFVIPFTCIIAAYGFDDARRKQPYAREPVALDHLWSRIGHVCIAAALGVSRRISPGVTNTPARPVSCLVES
jgi:hypothetical protein